MLICECVCVCGIVSTETIPAASTRECSRKMTAPAHNTFARSAHAQWKTKRARPKRWPNFPWAKEREFGIFRSQCVCVLGHPVPFGSWGHQLEIDHGRVRSTVLAARARARTGTWDSHPVLPAGKVDCFGRLCFVLLCCAVRFNTLTGALRHKRHITLLTEVVKLLVRGGSSVNVLLRCQRPKIPKDTVMRRDSESMRQ